MWCKVSFLCFVAVTYHGTLGSLVSYENRCCKLGQEWFTTSREQCGPYLNFIQGIQKEEQIYCAAIVEVCCLKEKHKKECNRGQKVASSGDSCVRLFSAIRNEVPRECCNCCKLGLVARSLGLGCHFLDKYGPPCSESFQSCCNIRDNTTPVSVSTTQPQTNQDINECTKFPHQLCAHICENTPGSYRCKCHSGFELQADGRTCRQIVVGNRCEITNPCQHTCEDTGEAIRCRCFDGYILMSDSQSCSDLNECQIGTDNCPPGTICKNTEGTFICERPSHPSLNCGLGFSYNPATNECDDVNECALSRDTCMQGQHCENTIGSYTCRRTINCGTGYTLDKESQQCFDDNECDLGTHNCGIARECRNMPGSFRCVRKKCQLGFRLNYVTGNCDLVQCRTGRRADTHGRCVDINECEEQPNVCQKNQDCINTVGSYRCKSRLNCGSGYEINLEGTGCQDVDECARNTHDCVGNQKCMNRPGTFHCMCPTGYSMNHLRRECDDIDECTRFGQVCALNSLCKNTPGSFICDCKTGFSSGNNGRTCKDVNECEQTEVCDHTCRNTWGSFQCTCNPGYQLAANKKSCEDIDECNLWSNRGRLCIGICQNTKGSYRCSCPKGYRMMSDGRTCQDIDECATRTANCNGQDDYCINTRGGYKCETITCPNGFIKAPPRGRRSNSVRCQRKTYVCAQGDKDCLEAPLSYSVNFITFPNKIRIPADLFTMRGPLNPYRRLAFDVQVIQAVNPKTGVTEVDQSFFDLRRTPGHPNEAVIQLRKPITASQDMELRLNMKIFSKEFRPNKEEYFLGTAVARIMIYVTSQDW